MFLMKALFFLLFLFLFFDGCYVFVFCFFVCVCVRVWLFVLLFMSFCLCFLCPALGLISREAKEGCLEPKDDPNFEGRKAINLYVHLTAIGAPHTVASWRPIG